MRLATYTTAAPIMCTTLDHIYPATVPGTTCYCGARQWGGAKKRELIAVGTRVNCRFAKAGVPVTGVRVVTERLREDGITVYRVDSHVGGRSLFEGYELEAQ